MIKLCGCAVLAAVLLVLLAGCGRLESAAAPTTAPLARTPLAFAPTATLAPPTETPVPASASPSTRRRPSPTATSPPRTDTPRPPLASPTFEPPSFLAPAAANLQGSILFSAYPEGDIAVMGAGGQGRRLLLDRTMPGGVFSDRLAAWRPDGKSVSYVVDDFEKAELWVMESDGSNARLLVEAVAPVTSHSWSPDGTRIAFVSPEHEICILDLAGKTVTNLTGEHQSDWHLGDARDPDWSPDGSRLAFSASNGQNQDIYLVNSNGTELTRLTSHEARDKHPDWSPNGTAIVFSSTRRSQRYPDLYSLDLTLGLEEEGNKPLQLTAEDKLEIRPDWSPDGAWIVFLSHELGAEHGTIYAVSTDGRFLVQITADNVYHSPRWRP